MGNIIAFPGLGINLGVINPVAFHIFGHPIMWYGLIIAAGFLAGAFYCMRHAQAFEIKQDDFLDMLVAATPVSVICARAYYVIFNYDLYAEDFSRVFKIWEGGIAIYGAIIGGILALAVFCRIRKIPILKMLDIGAGGLIIGQAIGRWGNFVNAEAYGAETQLPWAMSINNGAGVHPTFFYESLWNVIGFFILYSFLKKRKFSGQIFFLYISWYGLGRFFIEGLRADSLYFFGTGLRVSQCVALLSFLAGVFILSYRYYILYKNKKSAVSTSKNTGG